MPATEHVDIFDKIKKLQDFLGEILNAEKDKRKNGKNYEVEHYNAPIKTWINKSILKTPFCYLVFNCHTTYRIVHPKPPKDMSSPHMQKSYDMIKFLENALYEIAYPVYEIAYPVDALEATLKPGEKIDRQMAIRLCSNSDYLRNIAKKALENVDAL